ncbi:ROK family protein [Arthrobacter bambusae]
MQLSVQTAGSPPTSLIPGPGAPVMVFDVGGTDLKYGVVDSTGRFAHQGSTPTAIGSQEKFLDQLSGLVATYQAGPREQRPQAIAVNAPGIVDASTGVVVSAVNLGWSDFALSSALEARVGLPVVLGNDVQMAGLAEHRLGAAKGLRNALVLVIGTGIASAVILDGEVYDGDGYAGEIGHARMEPLTSTVAILCTCGASGCLQTVSSASAIARNYAAVSGTPVVGAKEVMDAAAAGDPAAVGVLNQAYDGLALAIAQSVALLAPQAVIFGGGLSNAGDALLRPVAERLDSILSFHRRPRLLPARFGSSAGLLGGAVQARRLLCKEQPNGGQQTPSPWRD